MRILIVSDTHGRHGGFDKALQMAGDFDFLIHLGDVEGGEDYIEAMAGCPCYIVGGNNDFFSQLPREMEISLGGKKFFCAHGHNYYVSLGPEKIVEEGRSRQADIVMFGHTHRPYIAESEGITVVNPGSLSYPRQEGRMPSFAMMEIDENGRVNVEIKFLK